MPVPHPVLTSLQDAQDNFDAVDVRTQRLVTSSVARALAAGIGTVVFTASTLSATVDVTHSLGVTPTAVLLTAINNRVRFFVTATTTTRATVGGYFETVLTGSFDFYWLAIG